jgi:hypothetical protein
MKHESLTIKEYIKEHIIPAFPVISRKINMTDLTTKIIKDEKDAIGVIKVLSLPKYGESIKYQNNYYKPTCLLNDDEDND